MTSKRANLPCEAIQIPYNIDRGPVFSNRNRRGSPVATTYGLRMAEAAGDISVIVSELGRSCHYKSIYSTLNVAGQKNHRSGKELMEDASLQHPREMAVCYDDVDSDVRQEKEQG